MLERESSISDRTIWHPQVLTTKWPTGQSVWMPSLGTLPPTSRHC